MYYQPIITIIADGWNREVFLGYLKQGLLPEISEDLLLDSILYKNVITVFPSVSLASHTTILTGSSQKEHRILCHRWIDKSTEIKNYVGIDALNINNDISNSVKTIFEQTSSSNKFSFQSIISRGATKKYKYFSFNSSKIIQKATNIICKNPDSTSVIWLPNCDALSHKYGPHSSQVKKEMIEVSKAIGKMISALKTNNLYENSKILFTSDHGFKEVRHRLNLEKLFKKNGFKVKTNSKKYIEGVNIFTNGDSIALININIPSETKDNLLSQALKLVENEGIELIIQKITTLKFRIVSKTGISNFEVIDNEFVNYILESGDDPLHLDHSKNKIIKINYSEINSNTINSKYPDLINQFLDSFIPESNIDMLITSKDNYHFGIAPRVGYRMGFHRGTHGGPSSAEMLFPAIIHSNNLKGVTEIPIRSKNLLNILLN